MATLTWADLRIPEAARLADLAGISFDLDRAGEYAAHILEGFQSGNPPWELLEPYSIAIAVTYSRSFVSGVRQRLDESDLSILTAGERAAHDRLRAYRDKHFAHSVNSFEENVPRAQYWEERVQEEGIVAIGYSSGRVAGMSRADLANVVMLTEKLGQHVTALIAEETKRLLPIIRSMPLREVLAGGQSILATNNRDPIGKARKKPFAS